MKIRCKKCNQKYEVDDSQLGRVITCSCSNQFIVTKGSAETDINRGPTGNMNETDVSSNSQTMECPACARRVSRFVYKCPGCGYPFFSVAKLIEKKLNPIFLVVSERTEWKIFLIFSLIFFFSFLSIGLYSIGYGHIDLSDINKNLFSLIILIFSVLCSVAFIIGLTVLWFIYVCRALMKDTFGQILLLLFVPVIGILICVFLSNQTSDNKLQTFLMKFLSWITFPVAIIIASLWILRSVDLLIAVDYFFGSQEIFSLPVMGLIIYFIFVVAYVTGGFLLSGMANTLIRPGEMVRQGGFARLIFVICFVVIAISVILNFFSPWTGIFGGYIGGKSFYGFFTVYFLPFWILFFSFRVFLQYNKRALESSPGGKLHDDMMGALRKN